MSALLEAGSDASTHFCNLYAAKVMRTYWSLASTYRRSVSKSNASHTNDPIEHVEWLMAIDYAANDKAERQQQKFNKVSQIDELFYYLIANRLMSNEHIQSCIYAPCVIVTLVTTARCADYIHWNPQNGSESWPLQSFCCFPIGVNEWWSVFLR